jgi:hypothetical protein
MIGDGGSMIASRGSKLFEYLASCLVSLMHVVLEDEWVMGPKQALSMCLNFLGNHSEEGDKVGKGEYGALVRG